MTFKTTTTSNQCSQYQENPAYNAAMVSVVIPNYNHAQYLPDAIQSVLDQDYSNFEIIVVDDGSTDDSRKVAAQFGNRVRYIFQENQGLSAARNTGIRESQGEFIGVLDADDMYESNFMSAMVSILETDQDAAGAYCGYRFVDAQKNDLPQVEARQIPDENIFNLLLDGNYLVPESMLVRHRCYDTIGLFDESLRACEDWDMWLRIAHQHKVLGTTLVLTRHRILPGSMSTDPLRMVNNRIAVLMKHVGPAPTDYGSTTLNNRRAYGRAYIASSVEYLQIGKIDFAYDYFVKMANVCPELLAEVDTYYQLGCGNQPKGSMGHLPTLDVQHSGQVLMTLLDSLFLDPEINRIVKEMKRTAYANAWLALGLLNYGARELSAARWYIFNAVRTEPRFGLNPPLIAMFIKSFIREMQLEW